MSPQNADLVSTLLWGLGIIAIMGMAFDVLPRQPALWVGISAMAVGGLISGYQVRKERRLRGDKKLDD
jgi:hypothetical protein